MKKVFILFMSHKSGEHGLTVHNSIEEGTKNAEVLEEDLKVIDEITGDGDFHELSDTTWFDVFEREIVLPVTYENKYNKLF